MLNPTDDELQLLQLKLMGKLITATPYGEVVTGLVHSVETGSYYDEHDDEVQGVLVGVEAFTGGRVRYRDFWLHHSIVQIHAGETLVGANHNHRDNAEEL